MTLRWRTDTNQTGWVWFGNALTNLNRFAQEDTNTTEHLVHLDGLLPDTDYFYAIHSQTNQLAGGSAFHFRTFPAAAHARPFRAWVLGDPGTGDLNAQAVYDTFREFNGTNRVDLLLTLGDNAYLNGTDDQLQTGIFDMYPDLLQSVPIFTAFGNHDARSSTNTTQSGPYFDTFSLPAHGESGGVPSATEAYYSFDYGSTHFICLDSTGQTRGTNDAMYAWATQDLAACTSRWIVAFWHHPPYSMGSHNSDTEIPMIEMRENFGPLMEQYGVDLVLCGHSHTYERTALIDGHYGTSDSYSPALHLLNRGDGRGDGDGIYLKPDTVKTAHAGTVYVIAGSSGSAFTTLIGDHPAIFTSYGGLGSVVLDVNDARLDLNFLSATGTVVDAFSIMKVTADYDGDADGMPDLWEQQGMQINAPPDGNADGDPDSNLGEYVAGTDPGDPDSWFNVEVEDLQPSGYVLHWNSTSNRVYDVQWAGILTNTMEVLQTNIPYPQNSYTDILHAARDTGFYRVQVRMEE